MFMDMAFRRLGGRWSRWFAGALLLMGMAGLRSGAADTPQIVNIDPTGRVTWNAGTNIGLAVLEASVGTVDGPWTPVFYGLATNVPRSAPLTVDPTKDCFYRLAVRTQPADPNLVLQYTFDSDFSDRVMVDCSGTGNNGYLYHTNLGLALTTGPDGSRAGHFHIYIDGWGKYGRSGDYIGARKSPSLTDLTNATISAWVWYYRAPSGDYKENHTSGIFSSGHYSRGAWSFGRHYHDFTTFVIFLSDSSADDGAQVANFPDRTVSTVGDSGGWNHYLVSFDGSEFRGYYNGRLVSVSTNYGLDKLNIAGSYLGTACWTFNRTPEFGDDPYPNTAFVNGAMDDLRIYNRALSAGEVLALYNSFDKEAPTPPTNVVARVAGSKTIEIRWSGAKDLFRIANYTVLRNGQVIGTAQGNLFVDHSVPDVANLEYAVEAADEAGHLSGPSASVVIGHPSAETLLDLVVDDADGGPWVTFEGEWTNDCCWIPGAWENAWRNDGAAGKGSKSVTYRPSIPETGEYEVFLRHVQRANFANNVPVTVTHADGTATATINQRTGGGTWKSLGRFRFEAGTQGNIRVDTTGTSGYVIADSIRVTR